MNPQEFIKNLTQTFQNAANPEIAKGQEAYMKNRFKYFGIKMPNQKKLEAPFVKQLKLADEKQLINLVLDLWDKEHREFQYVALRIISKHKKKLLSHQFLSIAEQLIRTKSWWDTVDALSSDVIGHLALNFSHLPKTIDTWIADEYFWIRRSAIIHQIMAKEKTDEKRLFEYCKKTMHEKEFFIRKAIGWALRQYSKTNPQSVKRFIEEHRSALSPLSIKEGSKYI